MSLNEQNEILTCNLNDYGFENNDIVKVIIGSESRIGIFNAETGKISFQKNELKIKKPYYRLNERW